jgi:hypothetical protein
MTRATAFAALALMVTMNSAQSADTKIHAEYTATVDRLDIPRQGQPLHQSFDVTLSGTNAVSETTTRRSGSNADNFNTQRALGQSASDGGFLKWQVAGANKLQRVVTYPQNITTMTIAVNGTSCVFNVDFAIKPRFNEFNFKNIQGGGMGRYSQPRVQSTSCTIR